jgi:hypothetical protein
VAGVADALTRRLAASDEPGDAIVWTMDGNEVVVHLDSVSVTLSPGIIRASVDLETDQTGRAAQEVVIAVAMPPAPPSLVAVSDDMTRGHALLAARWGRTLQDAVWGAVLGLADERAGGRAGGIAAGDGTLRIHARGKP